MDEAVFGFGLCCTAVPTIAAVVIAWRALSRAEEAVKKAEMANFRLEVLQKQLGALRAAQPQAMVAPRTEALRTEAVSAAAASTAAASTAAASTAAASTAAASTAAASTAAASTTEAPTAEASTEAASTEAASTEAASTEAASTEAAPPASPPVASPPAQPFEWEKWIGVRGAAVLGGIVFAMAGLYLFKYSIAQGWVSPTIRVMGAVLAGLSGLIASQRLRSKYEVTGQALGGGGVVVLYAATWAARSLYDLIGTPLAFVLMVLITAVAGVLAVKQNNRLAAYLGLVGGFATPLMLSTGQNAPGALFTYVFLLDLAVLGVAWKQRWKSMAGLALGATLLLEFGWVFTRMEPHQVWIAFVVMAVFVLLFTGFSLRFADDGPPTPATRALQGLALLTPTVVLLYFASSTTLAVPLAPTAGFLAVLLLGVGFIHRKTPKGEESLLTLSVTAVLLVLALAATTRAETELLSVTFLLVHLGLAAVAVVNVEWPQPEAQRGASLVSARWLLAGVMGVLLLAAVRCSTDTSHLTFSVGFAVVTLLFTFASRKDQSLPWQLGIGVAPAVAFAIDLINVSTRSHVVLDAPASEDPVLTLGPSLVLGLTLLAATFLARVERVLVSFVIATLALALFATSSLPTQPLQVLVALSLLLTLGVVGSIRGALRGPAFAAVLLFGLRLLIPLRVGEDDAMPWSLLFAVSIGAALLVHGLLFFAGPRFHEKPMGPVTLAVTLPAVFPGALLFWQHAFGRSMQGLLQVGLAVVALGTALQARRLLGSRAVMWLLAAACTLIAIAVPLQLENQWVTLSWALMAVGYLGLWRRFDSPGLKWLALTLLSFVSMRLLLNPAVLAYQRTSGVLFFNWLTYTYLVPAACLVAAAWLLAEDEVKRARGWEASLYAAKVPLGASSSAIGAALVVFAWVTLSVFDFFAPSAELTVTFDRLPARDLALSLSWILYSVALLAIGMWRRSRAMRWMSLVFLLASIGKVFLYDLGELKDLYRVASLMGLAVSLILISLAYQRFVFRSQDPK